MNKAEERSKEILQAALDYANKGCGVTIMDEFTRTLCISLGQAFMKGAEWADEHQAEKDNELTWDDVSLLNCLLNEVEQEFKKGVYEDRTYKGYCQEVLKRFKAKKRVWRSDDET